jgi:hypothetical protein
MPPTPSSHVRSILSAATIDWYENFCTPVYLNGIATFKFSNASMFPDTEAKHIPADASALQGIPDAQSKQTLAAG